MQMWFKKKPILDSDDMVPCWAVKCYDCGESQNNDSWSKEGAVKAWNNANPLFFWDDDKVIDFVNWYIKINKTIIDTFKIKSK